MTHVQHDHPLGVVIGFSPIEPRMLDIQVDSYGAKNMEEAMLMEVKSYLKCELRMLPSAIDQLNIMRTIPPANLDWSVLYVEYGSDHKWIQSSATPRIC